VQGKTFGRPDLARLLDVRFFDEPIEQRFYGLSYIFETALEYRSLARPVEFLQDNIL
jgi:hypothetical protein